MNEVAEEPRAKGRDAIWFILRPAAFAFLPAAFATATVKWITYKFPLNLLLPYHWAFLGLASALVLLVKIDKKERAWDSWLLAASVLFAFAFTQVKGLPLHFLIGETYYPYPKPPGAGLKVVAMVLAYLTAPAPIASAAILWRVRSAGASAPGRYSAALGLAGAAAGGVAVLLLIPVAGANLLVAATATGLGLYHARTAWKWAGVAGTAALMAFSFLVPDTFYTWMVRERSPVESLWTRSYKVDSLSFLDDRCMGGVLNHLMVMFVCDDPERLNRDLRIIASSRWLEKRNVLVLGRTDGAIPLILRKANPAFEKIDAVEIDPALPALFRRHGKYSGDILADPRIATSGQDFRNFLESSQGPYDTVFYHGLGIHLLNLPMSFVFEETYVYTKEAFELLFERYLGDDGVLVIDWGSSKEFEAYYLVANLPPGVRSRVVWSVTNEYPMTGLPLFLAVASRNGARVDGIIEELRQRAFPFREVLLPREMAPYQFTDDWPFMNTGFVKAQLGAGIPCCLAAVALVVKFVRRKKGRIAARSIEAFTGLLIGATYALLLARNTRLLHEGPADSEIWVLAAFWLGAAGALPWKGAKGARSRAFTVLLALGAGGLLILDRSARGWVGALALPPAISFAFHALPMSPEPADPERAAGYLASLVAGILLAQFLAFGLGYGAFHYVLAAAALAAGLASLAAGLKQEVLR